TASGVDTVPGTWIARWNLLGFLFVLLVSAAIGRLTDWRWGALALLALALCYPEAGSPVAVWLSLLAAASLARVLPDGQIRKLVRVWWWGSVAALVLAVVPFAVAELRLGMFPQLVGGDVDLGSSDDGTLMAVRAEIPPTTIVEGKVALGGADR